MLGKHIDYDSFLNPTRKNLAFDLETILYKGVEPSVSVSFNTVTLDSTTSISPQRSKQQITSSMVPTTAPCDICHRNVKRLFSLKQRELTYFVCHNCYKEKYKTCSKVTKSFVDSSKLTINSQPRVKWDDIFTTAEQFAPRIHKVRKKNRKNKRG